MFYRDKIMEALNAKRAALTEQDAEQWRRQQELHAACAALAGTSAAELCERLAHEEAPGALPTAEFDRQPEVRIYFPQTWQNVAEMRHWAAEALAGVTVCAVDGSQLPATKDFPLPVAAIQVAWFVNPHDARGTYRKDADVDVLTPRDLDDGKGDSSLWVGLLRYEREVAKVNDLMREHAGQGERVVVLFDGSLTVSFAGPLEPAVRDRYRAAAVSMLRTSEQCRVPLVAFIDRSRADDFARMLCHLQGINVDQASRISDAALLESQENGERLWRLPAFVCQRKDMVEGNNYTDGATGENYGSKICFTYVKTNSGRPARLEFPRWLLCAGMLDRVIDWVRAEAVVGTGYPYAIQAADAAAVIDFRDRQRYQRALEEFGQRHSIRTMQASAKQASKERRRT